MRLLKQILEKKMEYCNEFALNRKYLKSIWQFYCCYNISISILGIEDDKKSAKLRNSLWRKWFRKSEKFDEKRFKRIKRLMDKDMVVIIKAINYIDKEVEDKPYEMGDIDRDYAIGILSYEFSD